MNRYLQTALFVLLISVKTHAQLAPEINYPVTLKSPVTWQASWIRCPDAPEADYGVMLFRKSFNISEKQETYIVHVSADNRYKLYVNGKLASIGPQLSDTRHWRYETFDLSPYLNPGKNTIAAEVVNWGPDRFYGIISLRTAFLMQGATEKENAVNTPDGWKAIHNKAYYPLHLNWVYGVDIAGGFYASNPGDSIVMAYYPGGWNLPQYNDAGWKKADWIWKANNSNESGHYWLMKARTTPQVTLKQERFASIARSEGVTPDPDFIRGSRELKIKPNSSVKVLLVFQKITIGFPELVISGGKGSKITLRYAENLMTPDLVKGDRNIVEGKSIRGIHDVIMPDGRSGFIYSPLWYRAFRYAQIDVVTREEALVIHDFYNKTSKSPIVRRAVFETDDPVYKRIDDICWYTAFLCTQDNLISDAYYEQMMYVGDSKVHALVNLYMTGDDTWLRNAIEQFDYSRLPNGLLTSCYPVRGSFYHVNFSLYWIDMIYDFMMHCRDRQFVSVYAGNIMHTLDWFEGNRNSQGLVAGNFGKFFIDWYNDPPFAGKGLSPGSEKGNSATVTLQYVYTLKHAAAIYDYLDMKEKAAVCRERADRVWNDVVKACWSSEKLMFAENPDKKFFDARPNMLALKTGFMSPEDSRALFERCINDPATSKPVYFFRFHTFDVMRSLGLSSYLDSQLDIWKELLPLNLTTTPERQARQRSDAHPWSAYPSVAFIKNIAGIVPAEPEFRSVEISPSLGKLGFVKASYPHYLGDIIVDLKKKGSYGIEGTIVLPENLSGKFIYGGKVIDLAGGHQKISIKDEARGSGSSALGAELSGEAHGIAGSESPGSAGGR